MAAALAPMDRLVATLNVFLGLLGLPEVPELGGLLEVEDPAEALEPLADAVTLLQTLRETIPVP